MRIMGHTQGQCGQSCVLLQAGWEVRAQQAIVGSVRHCTYTTCSQFAPCPKSPGWDMVPDAVCKPHCFWPLFSLPRSTLHWEEVLVAVCRSLAANPTTAQEHNMLRCKSMGKINLFWASLCSGRHNSQANLLCIRSSTSPVSFISRWGGNMVKLM